MIKYKQKGMEHLEPFRVDYVNDHFVLSCDERATIQVNGLVTKNVTDVIAALKKMRVSMEQKRSVL